MRHNKKNNHLSRKTAHRSAMFSNMATSLIMHKRIFTTVPKAKALRKYVEPLINRSKDDSTSSRRLVFSYLQNKEAITELFQNISQKVADRPGGYTRIIKTGYRLGDNAAMCFIELVDYNENMLSDKGDKKAKTTRRSRRKASDKTEETPLVVAAEKAPVVAEEPTPKAKKAKAKAKEVAEVVEPVVEETVVVEEPKVEDTPAVEKAVEVAEEVPVAEEIVETVEETPAVEEVVEETPETEEETKEENK